MVNPVTVNVALIIPPTGADVDTWGANDINPNMNAIDGMLAGVTTVSLSNAPVTLTSPAGFTPTPSGGPTQSQNAVLKLTGTLTSNVTVTMPIPCRMVVDNQCVGAFVVTLRAVGSGQVIGLPPGETVEVYCDGTNVRFIGMGRVAGMEHWVGLSAIPAWVTACTVPPYLICAGTGTYTFAAYPILGAQMGSKFGGNGITTFGVPDMAGRVPLAYDSSGTRITVAGCGINGQTLGATLDAQTVTLGVPNLPPYTPAGGIFNGAISVTFAGAPTVLDTSIGGAGNFASGVSSVQNLNAGRTFASQAASTFVGGPQGGTSVPLNNVQPSIVTGIWVIRAA